VTVDLAVATQAFLDLTFFGLERLPRPGEEELAEDLLRTPGGGAITAIGAARLGLTAALVSPLGGDDAGAFVREALEREGVGAPEPSDVRTAVTVVMPLAGERAFVTFDPGAPVDGPAVRALAPRAVVADLDQLASLPEGPFVYASTGDQSAREYAGALPSLPRKPRALIVNEREALLLSGAGGVAAAAEALASFAETVVVTLGAAGAAAIGDGSLIEVPGVETAAAVDTTGAGDLFIAAYAWADQRGAGARERLSWAVLAAALSVAAPTGVGGAVDESKLISEGTRRGLAAIDAGARAAS
jgi:ribokinase